jgi:hypothetical protein
MIPLPELEAKSHTLARSRYSGKKMVTVCSQTDECADKSGRCGLAVEVADKIWIERGSASIAIWAA